MSLSLSENELIEACRILFGQHVVVSSDFLWYIQPCGAKSAYRQKAKETHPDLCVSGDQQHIQKRAEDFREVARAYQLINDFLKERSRSGRVVTRQGPTSPAPPRPANPAKRPRRHTPRPETRSEAFDPTVGVMEVGIFLYRRGVVTLSELAEALVWQRRQRPPLGEIACRWGWLTETTLKTVLDSRVPFSRFGEKAIRLGLLTPSQVRTLLFYQRSQQQRIGEYFIQKGIVSSEQMKAFVTELNEINRRARSSEKFKASRR